MESDERSTELDEAPLGGNLSASVRVGDTVRRRAGRWTPAVHALLDHLQRVGFTAAPRPLGFDERGRAVLEFIPGDVHEGWPDPMPRWMYEDEITLVGAAQLLRRYHDACAGFLPPPDARWRIVAPDEHDVICHNDWSPSNAVFRGRHPVVMLDWDGAGPGSRLSDVSLSAYNWVPLTLRASEGLVLTLPQRAARLATFCAAYGDVDPGAALDLLIELLPVHADSIQAEADAGDPGYAKLVGWDVPSRVREQAKLLSEQRTELLRRR